MRKFSLGLLFLFVTGALSAQDIYISFQPAVPGNRVDSIHVKNLTTNDIVTLSESETLLLTAQVTANQAIMDSPGQGYLYPNPTHADAELRFSTSGSGETMVSVWNATGQLLTRRKEFLEPGQHHFRLRFPIAGLYHVTVQQGGDPLRFKAVYTGGPNGECTVRFAGSRSLEPTARTVSLKRAYSGQTMVYSGGDVLLYSAHSGKNTTLLTDMPEETKIYPVEFHPCTDPDGKDYPVVQIGNQWWMAGNLAYLPEVHPGTDGSDNQPRYYVYNFDGNSLPAAKGSPSLALFGALYNWDSAVTGKLSNGLPDGEEGTEANIGSDRGICPPGWHLPTDWEWTLLSASLGGEMAAGGRMKETGTSRWQTANTGASNRSGFSVLPGGYRGGGRFHNAGLNGYFWTATETSETEAWYRGLSYADGFLMRSTAAKENGFSIRCIRGEHFPATLTTAEPANIATSSALLGGNVTSEGNASVTERGIVYATTQNPTSGNFKIPVGAGTGSFDATVTGLSPNTTYYVRAYGINSQGTAYGEQKSFTTQQVVSLPTVTTAVITDISQTAAIGGGTVTHDGNATVTTRGICWNTAGNPTTADDFTTNGTGQGTFISNLSGLTAGTTYYVRAYATNTAGTAYGPQVSFTTAPVLSLATVTTADPANPGTTSTLLGGVVTADGNATVTERGIVYSTTPNPTTGSTKVPIGAGTGSFDAIVTGLTPNTTYYVRAYAINNQGIAYGGQKSFATQQVITLPTVTTATITGITQTTATGGGNVTSEGNAAVTVRGICWNTAGNPTTADVFTTNGAGQGTFISNLSGLTAGTTYYVRAFANNTAGTAYGPQVSFTTAPVLTLATVTTADPANQGTTSALLGGVVTSDGNTPVTERGVVYATTSNPTTANTKVSIGAGTGSFDATVTGLTPNTTYYVRAYAINSQGAAYGEQKSFTTAQVISLPAVTTIAITDISQTTATGGGNVTSDGNASVTARGICWSTSTNPTTTDSKTTNGTGTGSFTSSLTGLTASTTYYVRAYATNSAGTVYGSQVNFTTAPVLSLATVTTTDPTGVTTSTVTLGGNVTSDGNAAVTERGVVYDIAQNPNTTKTKVTIGNGTGSFSSTVTGLTPNTTYYVRAYAINSQGTAYGEQKSFTTQQAISLPTVTTTAITAITQTTATGGGNVTSDGNAAVTARGVCWSTSTNPTTADSRTTNGTGTGSFTSNITGLIANTTYYVRAYATNSLGTEYGNQVSFTTALVLSLATLTTAEPANVSTTSALLGGVVTSDGNTPVTERGVVYATTSNPTTANTKVSIGSGMGSFDAKVTGFTSNTLYYVRAYAINNQGTAYGEQKSFTTAQVITLPTVSTAAITAIAQTTATGGGNVTSEGNAAVTARGVCWNTAGNPTTADAITTNGAGMGTFTSSLTGLTAGTTYYVRAFATNTAGTAYGTQVSFTTAPVLSLATVTTTDPAGVTTSTATLGGNVTSDGNAAVTERGVVYDTAQNPNTTKTKVTNGNGTGSFSSTVTGLTPNTTYYVRAYAINSQGIAYGEQKSFTTAQVISLPTVTTAVITAITQTTATGGGNVTSDGNAAVTARGVCWNTAGNPTTSDAITTNGAGMGTFTSSLTGLTASTTYYVRAYATNSAGTAYGSQVTFTTAPVLSLATVTTTDPSGVTTSTATMGGNVTSDGNAMVTERGVVYDIAQNPNTTKTKVTIGTGTGSFSSTVTGLTPNTTYYVRAYAINSQGTAYGEQKSFTTAQVITLPTVSTAAITAIAQTTATGGGNVTSEGNAAVTARGVCWNTAGNPTTADAITTNGAGMGTFTSSLTGLTAGTTYYVRAFATNTAGTAYGTQVSFTTAPVLSLATVTTTDPAGVTTSTATLGGNVTSDGNAAVTERGVVYDTAQNPNTTKTKVTNGNGTGSFSSTVTGLTPNTTYYVRAYAINSQGTAYGEQKSFTTAQVISLPTVTTAVITAITQTTATGGGNVTSDGNAAVTARGVCWNTAGNPTTADAITTNGAGMGTFTSSLTGLTAGTTYYVRAFATNTAGTAYGTQVSFTTAPVLSLATVTTTDPAGVTTSTATLGGNVTSDGNAAVTERGVVYDTAQNPNTTKTKVTIGNGTGSFSSTVTGLTPNTTYYVRAYAINSQGTAYGEQKSFTTQQAISLPTVTTTAITAITQTTATGGGNVTSDGNAAVTARGVCWSTSTNPTTADSRTTNGTGTGSFTSNITGMIANTTYYVRAYATNSLGTEYGNQVSFTTALVLSLATLTTAEPANVSTTSALLGGVVTSDGNTPVTERGVVYATTSNPTTANTKVSIGSGMGSFDAKVTGFTSNTLYYVRAYAINNQGTAYGEQKSFTTAQVITLPTVSTAAITAIAQTTATGGGNVTSEGNAAVTARGVCWNTAGNPTTADAITTNGAGMGTFTSSLTGLTAGTTYYVRAFATNTAGTAYGTQVSFTTAPVLSLATVTTTDPAGVTTSTATLGGNVTSDGNAAVTERGVVYDTAQNPNTTKTKVTNGNGTGSFSSTVTGLTPNTTYYVRAYAINSQGTAYGEQKSFTTAQVISLPTVTTAVITAITQTTATGGGNVTSDGNAAVTARGVCWNTAGNPTTADAITTNGAGMGTFTSSLTGLTAGTTYYVRAFATNTAGTAYGTQVSFTTAPVLSLATVTTTDPTGVTTSTVTLGGNVTSDGNAAVTERGVVYDIAQNPNTTKTKVTIGNGTGSFSSTVTGLTPNTTYYVRAYAINSQGTAYGEQKSFTTQQAISLPTVTTAAITAITQTTATGGGNVTSDGNAAVTARGVCLSTSTNPTTADSKTTNGTGTGSYTSNITGLIANTTYYVRAYATNSLGTAYGSEISFTTSPLPILATVTTANPGSITTTSALLGGNVLSDGFATVTERGIVFSTTPDPTTANTKVMIGSGIGSFSSTVTGLTPNTTYYLRAYAINSQGTAYGNEVSFTTLPPTLPTINTAAITAITQTTATGGGNVTSDGSASVTARGICWNTTQNPTTDDSKTTNGTGTGSFTSNLSNLTAGTTYYVRAYATNSAGTAYGNQVTFTTTQATTLPTVTTAAITAITQTTATGGGNVTNDGNATVTARGVCWSTSTNPTTANSITTNGTGTGSFTSSLTSLVANTTYYVRAYATNSAGTAYGNQVTFITTQATTLPTVTTTAITDITQTTATGGGNVTNDGNASVTARGVCWSTSTNPTTANSKTTNGTGTGSFTSNLTNLTANTLYYVRAYATNSQGTEYGNEVTFTTLPATQPSVTTYSMGTVTQNSASGGGNVTSDGGAPVTARGVCWSINTNPTTANDKTSDGTGTGSFTSNLTNLVANTTYYAKAYATNSMGTSYGNQVSFTTRNDGTITVTDADGNVYPTVTLGTQTWMAENLKTTKYRDGTPIPYVPTDAEWKILTTGGYSWFTNNPATYKDRYGGQYNWYAVTDPHNLCPAGWHVPTEPEWKALETYLIANGYCYDGSTDTNKIAKSMASKDYWSKSNITGSPGKDPNSNNSTGLNMRPGGGRTYNGGAIVDAYYGLWWTATFYSTTNALGRILYSEDVDFFYNYFDKKNGFSVRCLKD